MRIILFSICLVSLGFVGAMILFSHADKYSNNSKVSIICTTGMIADVVNALVKDYARVVCLMGPGIDPHMYRPRSGDIQYFQKSDIIFFNGLHLEGRMGDLFKEMQQQNKIVVPVGEWIDQKNILKGEDQEIDDPHIWHDVSLWKEVVIVIQKILCQKFEMYSNEIERNASNYINELEKLHNYILNQIKQIPPQNRILVTAHDAFRYFGRAYGITVIG